MKIMQANKWSTLLNVLLESQSLQTKLAKKSVKSAPLSEIDAAVKAYKTHPPEKMQLR